MSRSGFTSVAGKDRDKGEKEILIGRDNELAGGN